MQPLNAVIQSTAVELLQLIVARGDVDSISTESIEAIVVGKLYFSIHMVRLDLQNKLLHLLHSLISALTANLETAQRNAVSKRPEESQPDSATAQEKAPDTSIRYPVNPLLIQALIDGISTRSNRPVLQHWLDFILTAIPQFQPALQALVAPLNDCLCRQLLSSLSEVLKASSQSRDYADDISTSVTEAEMIMFLNGLERLILLSLAYTSEPDTSEDETSALEKPSGETSGLLGYVSGVFGSDSTQSVPSEQLTVCLFPLLHCVHSTDQLIRLVLRDTGLWMKGSEYSIQSGAHLFGRRLKFGHPRMNQYPSYTIGQGYDVAEFLNTSFVCNLRRFSSRLSTGGAKTIP
jgi:hypothetical protein